MRHKCPVCGLYVGSKPHTGAIHDRIFANRRRIAGAGSSRGLRARLRRRR